MQGVRDIDTKINKTNFKGESGVRLAIAALETKGPRFWWRPNARMK
jgi:hypothetical protein